MIRFTFSYKKKLVIIRKHLRAILDKWLCLTTLFLVFSAILTVILSKKISDAANIGDFLSGFAGALAFIWLIASFRQQKEELRLQRKELGMQRSALQLQAKELHKMGKYAALEQVNHMIQSGLKKLEEAPEGFNSVTALTVSILPTKEWKIILESDDPQKVYDSYLLFMKKSGPTKQFISTIANASKFYLEAIGNTYVDYSLPDINFIYINKVFIEKIPHISEIFYSTYDAVEFLISYEPGYKSITLAGFIAIEKVNGTDLMKKEAKEELYKYHEEKRLELPKIAK